MLSLHNLTIKKFHDGLIKKEFSALEITQAYFSEISRSDKKIHAYLSLAEQEAVRMAESVDIAVAKGEKINPLAGVPLAVKDNILIDGLPATAGSKILENYTSSYDAGAVSKLKDAQALFLGKTNMDEFAHGSSTENSAFGTTRNPHDQSRVPGGSSGGSAAAVAGNMALAALGSETGGSIRQPAAFCGVVGLKTTYGAVSRSGLIAMASSLDQIGPITKTVHDSALLFLGIAGYDSMDATSAKHDYEAEREKILNPSLEDVRKLTVGIPKEYFIDGLNPEIAKGVNEAISLIKSLGVQFKEISLPHAKYALPCYYVIMPAEVSSNLARFDGMRYSRADEPSDTLNEMYFAQRGRGFGQEAKRRIMLGTFVLSSGYNDKYYKKALDVRTLIKRDFDEAFLDVDLIVAPTTPTPPFKIGEKSDDPIQMYLSDIFTTPANLAGLPAISIPAPNKTSDNLPIGFQLIGRSFREADILSMGQLYERTTQRD